MDYQNRIQKLVAYGTPHAIKKIQNTGCEFTFNKCELQLRKHRI